MTDSSKQQPKYMILKQEILSWLQSGKLKPNDRMPTENEIAEQFGMSRQTVRQTFGVLEQDGWIYRVQGKGTFVSSPQAAKKNPDVQTIGIITTYISDYIFPHIVRGAEAALRSKGYRMLLSSTDNDKRKEQESLQMMMSEPLSGLIIEPTKSAEGNPNLNYYLSLNYQGIPYIMINESYPEISCPYIKMNDEAGGYQAAEHLIRLGHLRLAGFFKMDDLQGVNRLKGFIRAHQEYKVPLLPESVIHYTTETKRSKPLEAALAMLAAGSERPTALVCYNDELAVMLLDAVRQAGLSVPQDLSIIGFDDSALAVATEVKLTTLAHPKEKMGAAAAQLLTEMIERRTNTAEPVVFEPELIVRDSTGPVPV
ncbi:GntR family transcriptional regulator [Paenibacillus doosanensis]|uniref:Arabinose metabolism transcriptional repressor n=1 Tax=Paenibacillus konkukensis TaxID=2020716 RepID=A0ABY4RJ27_9BACL|nr:MULTISPECIES: GntR family transcriptional regulator [Paenibacillus]MCS7464809.1 GntR family transcriptional regulator [Paenibacillus doosanensis]UQZ82125.1 Arabinose metabolism transcriptional repressor [Paenibacillus konkukensis]